MNQKASLYAVVGGVVGAVLAMVVGGLTPLGAQNENATFDTLTCRSLTVADGGNKMDIQPHGIVIMSTEKGGAVIIGSDHVLVMRDGKRVSITIGEQGGTILVSGQIRSRLRKEGTWEETFNDGKAVVIGIDDHGGKVKVDGKGAAAEMQVTEYGGYVNVYGNNDDETRATMSVNSYGNGVVNTWDKNGYRLATLK